MLGGKMKVKELIELLSTVDKNLEVILSKDGEGNGYSPFSDHTTGFYQAYNTWSGEFAGSRDIAEEPEEYEDYDVPAIVLWPVN
jgi:hypothetical protein